MFFIAGVIIILCIATMVYFIITAEHGCEKFEGGMLIEKACKHCSEENCEGRF